MFHEHLRRKCILLFLDGMSYKYQSSLSGFIVSFKACDPLFIFILDYVSIDEIGVLMSPAIIVLLSISPFMAVSICLMYCGAPMLGA